MVDSRRNPPLPLVIEQLGSARRVDSSLRFFEGRNLLIQLRKSGDMVGRVGIEPTTN